MKQYVVDAFTDKIFGGNPAAVCIMDSWIDDDLMMKITCENNLSETAFAVKDDNGYKLRWFTPGGEIDLCGHATLGTAFVIMSYYETNLQEIIFHTRSGNLTVTRKNNLFEMNFPAYKLEPVEITSEMVEAIGATPVEAYLGRDLLCVFENEKIIKAMNPNMEMLKKLDGLLLHVTARGKEFDCVSRSFAPKINVPEDPVCGSGHCHIIPYWSSKLNEQELTAYQASKRGGVLYCCMNEDRIKISGNATLYAISELFIQ